MSSDDLTPDEILEARGVGRGFAVGWEESAKILQARIDKALGLHKAVEVEGEMWCKACLDIDPMHENLREPYPCPTRRALEGS